MLSAPLQESLNIWEQSMALNPSTSDISNFQLTPADMVLIPPGLRPPSFFDAHSRSGYVIWVVAITYGVAGASVALRTAARLIPKNPFWWDDYLIFGSIALLTGLLAATILAAQKGIGRHVGTLPEVDPAEIQGIIFGIEILFLTTASLVKASILAFYWRIFGVQQSIRKPIWIGLSLTLVWAIVALCCTLSQCVPIQKLWRPASEGRCYKVKKYFLGTAIPNFVIDLLILALPAPYVWKLRIKRSDKFLVMGTFLLGGFAAISAIVRLWAVATMDYNSADETWTATESVIWGFVEPCFGIISACLPMLRPLVTRVRSFFVGNKEKSFGPFCIVGLSRSPPRAAENNWRSQCSMIEEQDICLGSEWNGKILESGRSGFEKECR